jgi:hypothetical protein
MSGQLLILQSLHLLDGDNIGDLCDNCVNVANNGQDDLDQNGFGDSCDPSQNKDRYNSLDKDLLD